MHGTGKLKQKGEIWMVKYAAGALVSKEPIPRGGEADAATREAEHSVLASGTFASLSTAQEGALQMVEVTICKGRELGRTDFMGLSDPYAVLSVEEVLSLKPLHIGEFAGMDSLFLSLSLSLSLSLAPLLTPFLLSCLFFLPSSPSLHLHPSLLSPPHATSCSPTLPLFLLSLSFPSLPRTHLMTRASRRCRCGKKNQGSGRPQTGPVPRLRREKQR
jgi:hypothetical protein